MSQSGSLVPADRGSFEPIDPRYSLVGKVVDAKFRVLSHIASGGMADVYRVEHIPLGRQLAMKVLRHTKASSPALARRFAREAQAASRLQSEHVVSIHDYGELQEGFPYFVMELLEGQTLREELRQRGTLPLARVANLAIDVCLGLNAAHRAGLVHRDLKPENLWLARGDDERERCILLDFGVARFTDTHSTGEGVLVGTARYMSPEQITGAPPPSGRSDLFALATIIIECVTGNCPFAADSLERTLFRVLNDVPRPLHELVPDVPEELSRVLERALAKPPECRFESALALAASLRPFAAGARPLPRLDVAPPSFSLDTLAEDETTTWRDEAEPIEPEPTTRSPQSYRRIWVTFGLGVLLGAGSLWVAGARLARTGDSSERVVELPTVMDEAPAPKVSSAGAPSPSVPSEPAKAAIVAVDPVGSVTVTTRAPLRRREERAAPAPESSARPPLPRPDFDGRNPYLE
ncbi:MAG: serine/threonine protein kinase [Polyangiaceae bacterium]|jgi:serine/threonine-protein kinase|nr:serine/threonine protein kinase [Polyangiaceae bacterium]